MRKGCAGRVALGSRSSWVTSRSLPQLEAPGVLSPKQGPSPWGLSPGVSSTPCTNAELRSRSHLHSLHPGLAPLYCLWREVRPRLYLTLASHFPETAPTWAGTAPCHPCGCLGHVSTNATKGILLGQENLHNLIYMVAAGKYLQSSR